MSSSKQGKLTQKSFVKPIALLVYGWAVRNFSSSACIKGDDLEVSHSTSKCMRPCLRAYFLEATPQNAAAPTLRVTRSGEPLTTATFHLAAAGTGAGQAVGNRYPMSVVAHPLAQRAMALLFERGFTMV